MSISAAVIWNFPGPSRTNKVFETQRRNEGRGVTPHPSSSTPTLSLLI